MSAEEPVTPLGTVDDSQDCPRGEVWIKQYSGGVLQPGDLVDRYVVEARLGEGGAATVYRVRHQTLEVVRALKVLRIPKPDLAERFLAEGRLQARLSHPNLVRVYDALMVRDLPALLLELIEGPTLAQYIAARPPNLEQAERLFRGVVAGVARAHREGVVHRDLKPANVLLDHQDGRWVPRVADFGIARVLEGLGDGWTQTGGLLGTPAYMAPEQIRAPRGVDKRADLFSLGVILYELCSGVRPFAGSDMLSLLNAVDRADYAPIQQRTPQIPEHLRSAIEGCLQADPAARIPDCQILLRVLDGEPWRASQSQPEVHSASQQSSVRQARRVPWRHHGVWALLLLLGAAWAALAQREHRDDVAALRQQNDQLRGDNQRLRPLSRGFQLYGEAWRRAGAAPAASLALLRGAAALLPEARPGGEPIMGHEPLWRLTRRGGASVVVAREDAEWSAVAVTRDGKTVLGGNDRGELVAWERDTGQERFRVTYYEGLTIGGLHILEEPGLVLVQPDVLGSEHPQNVSLRAYSLSDGRMVHEFGGASQLHDLRLTDHRAVGLTSNVNEVLNLWDMSLGEVMGHVIMPGSQAPGCFAMSPRGTYVASAYRQAGARESGAWPFNRIRVTKVEGREVVLDRPMSEPGCRLHLTEDELWVQSARGTTRVPLSGEEPTSLRRQRVVSQLYSPRSRFVVNNFRVSQTTLLSLPEMKEVASLAGGGRVYQAAFTEDGRWLVTAHTDKALRLWSTEAGSLIREYRGHNSWVLSVGVSPQGDIVTGGKDGTVRVWPGAVPLAADLESLGVSGGLVSQTRRGQAMALATGGGAVELRRQGQPPVSLQSPFTDLRRILLSPSGRYLFVMDRDHQVALWDNESPGTWRRWRNEPAMLHWRFSQGEEALLGKRNVYFAYYHLKSGTTETRRMTYKVRQLQARGDEVFLSTEGGALAVMKMEPRAEVRRLQSQGKDLGALAVTQDGSLVAVANWEGEVSLWSRDTGRRLWHAREHTDGVPELAVSPNQEVIASRSWDETVKLLDVRREAPAVTLRGHDQSINCMRFSPDGTRLATGGRDATVRIWDVATGRLLWLREASSEVHFLTWSPEGVLQARTRAGRLWTWALGPMRDPDLRSTGALTNLRVCQNSDRVVEVVPFPAPESVWAPEALCRQAPDPEED